MTITCSILFLLLTFFFFPNQSSSKNYEAKVQFVVGKIDFLITNISLIDAEMDRNQHSEKYTIRLTLVSKRDYLYTDIRNNTKERPFSGGFDLGFHVPLRTMKHLAYNFYLAFHSKTTILAECNENVLNPIQLPENSSEFVVNRTYLCGGKILVTYRFNYTCYGNNLQTSNLCENESEPYLYYNTDHYQCTNGTFCQSLLNASDNFSCSRPLPTTSTAYRTRRTVSTKTTTTTRKPSTSSSTWSSLPITAISTNQDIFPPEQFEDRKNVSKSEKPEIVAAMFTDGYICLPVYGVGLILSGILGIVVLNICCLVAMRQNHDSYHELFFGNPDKKSKKDQQTYHANDELYSKPWDDKENSALEHLFVSMPDIRQNLVRQSDHIYAVPQNLNNTVIFRNHPNDPYPESPTENIDSPIVENEPESKNHPEFTFPT